MRHQIGVLSPVVTTFLIPDNHIGRATFRIRRRSEVQQMGGRSIACLNARDRNLLGFRRDLLTAAAYGVDQSFSSTETSRRSAPAPANCRANPAAQGRVYGRLWTVAGRCAGAASGLRPLPA